MIAGVDPEEGARGPGLAIRGNAPNPFRSSTLLRYRLGAPGNVSLEVFDVGGRRVGGRALGYQQAGDQVAAFERAALGAGVYQYRLSVADPETGTVRAVDTGRMLLLK